MLLLASIVSATESLGNYSQMTTASASSTRSEGCAEEGRISAVERRGEAKVGWAGCEEEGARCGCGDVGQRQTP
jgi:hypothetical protein